MSCLSPQYKRNLKQFILFHTVSVVIYEKLSSDQHKIKAPEVRFTLDHSCNSYLKNSKTSLKDFQRKVPAPSWEYDRHPEPKAVSLHPTTSLWSLQATSLCLSFREPGTRNSARFTGQRRAHSSLVNVC